MASPQRENGHIDIANEIAEALARTQLNGYESRYLWVLFRKTYGWQKKEDRIPISQFIEATGLKKQHIWRTQQRLIQRNIVTKNGYKIGFQKDYTRWREVTKLGYVTKNGYKGNQIRLRKVTKNGGLKRHSKDIIQKPFVEDSIEFQLAKLLLNKIKERKADFKQPNLQKWTKYIDLMIKQDERKPDRIKEVIKWCQDNEFWQNNILSPKKLRQQFDQLEFKMGKEDDGLITSGLED